MKTKTINKRSTDRELRVTAHYYCGLMGEAIYCVVQAHTLQQDALRREREGDDSLSFSADLSEAGLLARYAFLLAANALENCAYAILVNCKKLSSSLVDDIEKLSTLNKFEIFALIHGKSVNRGDDRYAKLKEVIRCRNAFVHPKNLMVPIELGADKALPRVVGTREYPHAFDFLEIDQVALMIRDMLRFVAWVIFDICKFSPAEGAELINGGTKWWIMAFYDA